MGEKTKKNRDESNRFCVVSKWVNHDYRWESRCRRGEKGSVRVRKTKKNTQSFRQNKNQQKKKTTSESTSLVVY